MGTPIDEAVALDAAMVRGLLVSQHPDLAGLPIEEGPHGYDNRLWRIGDRLLGRFPSRAVAAPLAHHEQRWLPELAPRLPLPVPAPVRT
ncbi:MAG: phosphotransferase, partial [Acidimicrobiales bacterium]